MKLKEIIQDCLQKDPEYHYTTNFHNVYKSLFGTSCYLDYDWDKFTEKFKKIYYRSWYCTDSYVGAAILTLNGEPVALSYQSGRKSQEIIEWLSDQSVEEAIIAVNEVLIKEEDYAPQIIKESQLDIDMGEGYYVEYSGQFLLKENTVVYDRTGETVEVLKTYRNSDMWNQVQIKRPSGVVENVPVKECMVRWNNCS